MFKSGKVLVVDGAVERGARVDGVDRSAQILAIGFYVHVVLIQEMIDHSDGFLGVRTFTRAVEGHAAMRVRAAGYEVVEQLYIPCCGDIVEDL